MPSTARLSVRRAWSAVRGEAVVESVEEGRVALLPVVVRQMPETTKPALSGLRGDPCGPSWSSDYVNT